MHTTTRLAAASLLLAVAMPGAALAAGGYITPDEYKKKQAIIDSM